MQKIVVVGGGLIGQGWAVVFAQAGYTVAIYDPSEDVRKTVLNLIKQRIADLVSAELVTAFLGEKMQRYGMRWLSELEDQISL